MTPTGSAQAQAPLRGVRKTLVGLVTSNRMAKTIVVRVDRLSRHPVYQRVLKHSASFKAHDEKNEAKIGDLVKVMETRPLSKDKRWRLVEIVRKASLAPPVPDAEEPKAP
ncbi:MAG: 30S ribosomal protein S17 [Candidatus Omnitrophica bacterium]|nr:30S ribosomal protein S17 [Candidatus Omnitrophota bacterium]